MIDIHSHIIPNIDDGSNNIDMSLAMLKRACESGTSKIVATPHFFRGYWVENKNVVKEKVEELNKLARDNNLNIEIYAGQEIFFTDHILDDFNNGEIGTINDSKYMLIEFPMDRINFQKAIDGVYELKIRGIVPIIAHPERYVDFMKNPEMINQFIEEGYLFQLNGGSINGMFGKEVKKTAETFLEHNVYSFMGSDAHSNGNRNTSLAEACETVDKLSKGASRRFEKNALALLNNEKLIFQGEKVKKKKKGLFSFFKK